jgi:hypothetical protein
MYREERYAVRVLLAKFGRSRMRLAVIDFGDVVIFADEFGNVGRLTKNKVEVPSRWEETAYDAYVWLYTPREEAKEFADAGRVEKAVRVEGQLPLKRLILKGYDTFLGYVVDLPDPPRFRTNPPF